MWAVGEFRCTFVTCVWYRNFFPFRVTITRSAVTLLCLSFCCSVSHSVINLLYIWHYRVANNQSQILPNLADMLISCSLSGQPVRYSDITWDELGVVIEVCISLSAIVLRIFLPCSISGISVLDTLHISLLSLCRYVIYDVLHDVPVKSVYRSVVLFIGDDTLCYSENCALITSINSIFAAHAYARAVWGVVILSVWPSVTRVHCDKTK